LKIQLQEFNERTRSNPVMASIASKLTELEIEAVTTYISGMGTEAQTSVSR
jgi:cytochrome c553